jgi:serine/threonine protein kinase
VKQEEVRVDDPRDRVHAPSASAQLAEDPRLAEALDTYRTLLEVGRRPDRREFLGRYPDLAEALSECLAGLEFVHAVAPHLSQPADATGSAPRIEGVSSVLPLGDYRILRELGRGGMGVVYEALQLSLGRRVALKVLPFAAAVDARQLQRFRNEAQAAAQLHHSNIVPVYAVGTERGVHYYAMQLIEGYTLAALIEELRAEGRGARSEESNERAAKASTLRPSLSTLSPRPSALAPSSYIRTVAGLAVQAAEALEHAHQMGVIHRDIKPANLMVDLRGNLWVTDFGLAHCQQQAGLTLSGDLLGTLRYMSPEQALAKRVLVDHRTDIYSLGVSLYELLTLEPAFPGSDRQELLRQIAFEEPRPLRRLDRSIPADLETIVQKALAKNPAERYASARELADDLERFLADQPIQARRPTPVQRLRKWARRHQAAVTVAVVSGFVCLLLAVGLLLASNLRIANEKAQTRTEKERADDEKQRAEANLRTVKEAVDRLMTRVADELADKPQMEEIRQKLLEDALEFYQGFLRQKSTDPVMRHETAHAYMRVAGISQLLGRTAAWQQAIRQAIALLEQLATEFPAVPVYRVELAGCHASQAASYSWGSQAGEGKADISRVLEIYQRLATEFPMNPDYQKQLAEALYNVAAASKPDDIEAVEKLYRQAVRVREKIAADFPQLPPDRTGEATLHQWFGVRLLHNRRFAEAEKELRYALRLREQLLARSPDSPGLKADLLHLRSYIGEVSYRMNRPEEAERYYRQIVEQRENLYQSFPHTFDHERRLVLEYNVLALVLIALGRMEEAEAVIRKELAPAQQLVAKHPNLAGPAFMLAGSWYDLALLLHVSNRASEAAEAFRQAFGGFERFAARFPEYALLRYYRAWCLATCPAVQFRQAQQAVEEAKQALQRDPAKAVYWLTLGVAEYRVGHWLHALEALEKGRSLDRIRQEEWALFFLAMTHWQLGQKPMARQEYEQAVRWLAQDRSGHLDLPFYRAEAAALLGLTPPAAGGK